MVLRLVRWKEGFNTECTEEVHREHREPKSGPPRKAGPTRAKQEGGVRRRTQTGLWSGGWASKLVRVMHRTRA
jgi:hypothetical protein